MKASVEEVKKLHITAAEAIVTCLQMEEIEKVFCVPGESYLPVLDALYDATFIQVISARHEGGASFMAEGYAKSTLKPGVVFATRGVGATNLSIGVHTAYQDSTPMVVFLGQVHSQFRGREGFQEIDLEKYFAPITKWAVEVKDAKRMPELVQRAFKIAKSGRPGPVIVSLPEDVLPIQEEMIFRPAMNIPKPAPSETEINHVKQLLNQTEHPLIIAGGGVKNAQAELELLHFAEKYSIPVMASFRRHDVFPNDHRLYVGHLGLGVNHNILETVKEADLIIALGTRLSEVTTQDYSLFDNKQKLIHIDISFDTLGKVYTPEIGILADAKEALKALFSLKIQDKWTEWARNRRNVYEKVSRLKITKTDVINKHVIAKLVEKLPTDSLLTNDAGNFAGWLHSFYQFKEKHTYVGPTSGAMGYGMPAALGAKLAYPEKTVVSLSGDGGFMMTVQELETAVRYDIPIIALVFNNEMYGTIRMHQEMHYPNRVMATDLGGVSFSGMAKELGANGYQVHTIEQFESAFLKALTHRYITVIEILTEKEQISVTSTIEDIRQR